MSKELEVIAEGMRAVATEGAREDGQLWGAFPNAMTLHDLAAHVVSVLSAHGYSIVPSADVKSVRMVAEYALHLRVNGERAPGGDESWPKFDRFAEAVLRATGPAAAAAEEDTNGRM